VAPIFGYRFQLQLLFFVLLIFYFLWPWIETLMMQLTRIGGQVRIGA